MGDVVSELRKPASYEAVAARKRPKMNRWQMAIKVFEVGVAIAVAGLLAFVVFG